MQDINWFSELFLSIEMWGYFGPLGLVILGYFLTKKDKPLGIFMIIVDSLVLAQYLALVAATPDYWWQIVIVMLGIFVCTGQMWSK